jgi:hypothetical protein
MKVLMMTLMYLSLVIIHQVGARVVPMTHVKTFNSMHRLASFAFIPPTAEESLGETVRFFQNSCIILYYFFTFFFVCSNSQFVPPACVLSISLWCGSFFTSLHSFRSCSYITAYISHVGRND